MTAAATGAAPKRPWQRRWSLQTRLMVTVVGIVALTLVASAIGLATIIGSVLTSNVDTSVEASTRQLKLYDTYVGRVLDADQVLSETNSLPVGYALVVTGPTGDITAATLDEDDGVMPLTSQQSDEFLAGADSAGATTVEITGLGAYRVVSWQAGPLTGVAGLSLAQLNATIAQLVTTIVLVTSGGLLLLSAAIAVVINRSFRPLRIVAATAQRVAAQPLARGEVTISERVPASETDEDDEIGRVGAALNTLLDHVDSSLVARHRNEERMRSFVADASHELRTPLASIRGYSELSLRALSAGMPNTEATTISALERIQAQSLRMTSLVEDLLLLARLDEGQELVYGALDLSQLAVESVADARVAGADHEWVLDVPDQSVVVAADGSRITQVVANLLANARVHTPAGTSVTTSVRIDDGTAVLAVHDDGPGIDPAAADEIFERFSRADRSRARQTGGTGLGLSIARAIVSAHGGSLTVRSEPGSTTFELRLPARPADPDAT
ncbi:sensor histidine kinase [Microbacterium radiodurans]|uniref:histidine kinase n=1 Tax=Microbacterium radiodurans TaxID=661398 RepID=A0A5J5IRB6_9MICO|nr:ATP-binding protein [Microbacterium radiodurans]KAA9086601.1 HAMP domain-containing protein [Microbacterium radiodurans]